MSNAAKFVAFVSCAVVLLSAMGEGCYQPSTPRLTVHAKNLSGLIVNHEKPWAGAQVSLREWPGMYIDDQGRTRLSRQLASTITDINGRFDFQNIKPDLYAVLIGAEGLEVRMVAPEKDQNEEVRVEFYADMCERAFAGL